MGVEVVSMTTNILEFVPKRLFVVNGVYDRILTVFHTENIKYNTDTSLPVVSSVP